jgi:hypothetical protein
MFGSAPDPNVLIRLGALRALGAALELEIERRAKETANALTQ